MALLGIHDVHKLCTHRVAIRLFQCFKYFTQSRIRFANMHATGLEYRVEVCSRQLVEGELEISHVVAGCKAQRIESRFLVPTLAIGRNELNHPNLLALVFSGLGIVLHGCLGAHPHFTDLGEAVADDRVRNILNLNHSAFYPWQLVKVVPPLLGHTVGVFEV